MMLKFFWVTLENSKNLFPRASGIQSLWNSSCRHLLPLPYGRAAVISVCNICYCSPQFLIFYGKLSNKSEVIHVNKYSTYFFFFLFIPYFAGLQAQFVWKINFCFNNMLEKYFPIFLPLITVASMSYSYSANSYFSLC